VQKVIFALYALEPHDDAQQQAPQEEALISAETGATTCGRCGGGAGAVDWRYINKYLRITNLRSVIVMDGLHKKFFSS